jgi:hypothetical protein
MQRCKPDSCRRAIFLAFVSLTLVGCATPVARPELPAEAAVVPATETQLRTLRVSPRHVNIAPVTPDGSGSPLSMAYIFPVVQGQVFGHQDGKALSIVDENRATFDLHLNDLWVDASAAAQPLTAEARESGIHIVPEDTALFRVGTLTGDLDKRQLFLANVEFRDPMADTALILVYVDRPCRITGLVEGVAETAVGEVELDVALASAGFHWLSFVPNGNGRASVREHAYTDSVLLVVRPQTAS